MPDHNLSPHPRAVETTRGPQPTLFVMVGLPAAGKTTMARRIETEQRAIRFTPDDWMNPLFGESMAGGKRNVLEGRFIATSVSALRLELNVILDFGVWSKDERTALRWIAMTVGARCELVYAEVDAIEQRERVDRRFRTAPETTFPISRSDLEQWRAAFEPPSQGELAGDPLDPPPASFESWDDWLVDWWPTSLS